MAHPKRKSSKARRSHRRAQYYNRLSPPTLTACSTCGAQHQTHRACITCGTYRGRQVLNVTEAV